MLIFGLSLILTSDFSDKSVSKNSSATSTYLNLQVRYILGSCKDGWTDADQDVPKLHGAPGGDKLLFDFTVMRDMDNTFTKSQLNDYGNMSINIFKPSMNCLIKIDQSSFASGLTFWGFYEYTHNPYEQYSDSYVRKTTSLSYNTSFYQSDDDNCDKYLVLIFSVQYVAASDMPPVKMNLDHNGGTSSIDFYTYRYLKTISLLKMSYLPTRSGYKFLGYYRGGTKYIDENGNNLYYGSICDDIDDFTVTAKWERYNKLSFNGGVGGPSAKTYLVGQTIPSSVTKPTRTGYTFAGYYTGLNKTGIQIFDINGNFTKKGTSRFDSSGVWTSEGDLILYAGWDAKTYTYVLNENYGSNPTKTRVNQTYGGTIPTRLNFLPTRTGYIFEGYYYGDTQVYNSSGDFANNSVINYIGVDGCWWGLDNNLVLNAHWTAKSYRVLISDWSGEMTVTDSSIEIEIEGEEAYITTIYDTSNYYSLGISFSRVGYTFRGLCYYPDLTLVYDANCECVNGTGFWSNNVWVCDWDSDEELELMALYSANTYNIKLDKVESGATLEKSSFGVVYERNTNGSIGASIVPTLNGKYFLGWYTAKTDGIMVYGKSGTYNSLASDYWKVLNNLYVWAYAGDVTLYAHWQDTWAMHTSMPSGSGESSSPYLITSPEELAWIAYNCNWGNLKQAPYVSIQNEINLNDYVWYPIGTNENPFDGKMMGNMNFIKNIYCSNSANQGLFGYIRNAIIEEVYINGFSISSSVRYCGALVGNAKGGSTPSKITNCYIKNVKMLGIRNLYAGGIVGSATSVEITDCFVESNIRGTVTTQGIIVGEVTSGVTIKDCIAITGGKQGVVGSNSLSTASCESVLYSNSVDGNSYIDGDFANWVYVDGMDYPLPTGLAWLAKGACGEVTKDTIISAWTN